MNILYLKSLLLATSLFFSICVADAQVVPKPSTNRPTTTRKKSENSRILNKKTSADVLVIGTWTGVIEGDKLVVTFYSDNTMEMSWYHSNFTQYDRGDWQLKDHILYEQYEAGGPNVCKIEFRGNDHLIVTVLFRGYTFR